jgi:uncharacterized protein YegL
MNQQLTELIIVLDKSGSMSSVADDTIGGFNTMIAEQKKIAGEIKVTLALFDDEYELVHDGIPIQDIKELTAETYLPGGWTALLDAVGKTIDSVGARLTKTPEDERPSKVILAILTDGGENSSKEYQQQAIADKIKHQTEKYQWQFLFLGANQDAFAAGGDLGVCKASTTNFAATGQGVRAAYFSVSSYAKEARTGGGPIDVSAVYNAAMNSPDAEQKS